MRKKWLSGRQPILPYAEFVRQARSFRWEHCLEGELRERLSKTAERAERYSLLAEAVLRVEGIRLFDAQLAAARAMEEGRVVQLATGEGKTLAAVVTAASLALQGKMVHILVFNDYLARRDFEAHGDVFRFCGLRPGLIEEKSGFEERGRAYDCQVLYVTAREAGFDYLKNFLCMSRKARLNIPFQCAIVDEADSVLIDEARIPLVAAGPAPEARTDRYDIRGMVEGLTAGHWETDGPERRVWLTDEGISAVESALGLDNLFAPENGDLFARVGAALEAKRLLVRDRDYLVRRGEIKLIDRLTGRVAEGRRYPDLLHRALEEKEELGRSGRTVLYNSMPLQFFLLQYELLAGMTGTAEGCEGELRSMYGVETVVIPSRTPCMRIDRQDAVFFTEAEKEAAVIESAGCAWELGRPVLLGTQSVAQSQRYAALLRQVNIPCRLLNAANDEEEAEVIAEAGGPGRVTVSTSMAGRGVDIRLGGAKGGGCEGAAGVDCAKQERKRAREQERERERERVLGAGGLLVLGCGLAPCSRVDRQLRGRAGRQGDPGESRFFISLEEPIFQGKLAVERTRGLPAGRPRPDAAGLVRDVRREEEGRGAEARYMLERYAFIQEEHRRRITAYRDALLFGTTAPAFFREGEPELYEEYVSLYGKATVDRAERRLALRVISRRWSDYLMSMENVRTGIHLTVIGGCNPLDEYNRFAAAAFEEMRRDICRDVAEGMKRSRRTSEGIDPEDESLSGSTEIWTYMIDESAGQFARLPKFAPRCRK